MHLDELLLKSQGRFLRFCFLRELGAFLGHSRKDQKDLGRTSEGPRKDLCQVLPGFELRNETLNFHDEISTSKTRPYISMMK